MLDIKTIRENPAQIEKLCKARGVEADVSQLLAVDNQRRRLLAEVEGVRAKSNQVAASVRSADPATRQELLTLGSQLKKEARVLDDMLSALNEKQRGLLMSIPNQMPEDTPPGLDSVELGVFGEQREFDFRAKDHVALGSRLGLDLEAGARVAGSGFPLMRGQLALLEMSLLRFVYDRAVDAGFLPMSVPLLARQEVFEGLGFNPRRGEDGAEIFNTVDDLCLAGTAEISLVGQFAGQTLSASELPLRVVAMTPCFRREGAYGRRDAGLYRNKMFNKVELVIIAHPDDSDQRLEEIRAFELGVYGALGLFHRLVRIASADLGAPAYKKYDIEGWMLGRGEDADSGDWGELTSCSNCTDYQARRLDIKFKDGKDKPQLVHTLNGTGVTTRALICLLEQYQLADGSVRVPEALRPHLGGREALTP